MKDKLTLRVKIEKLLTDSGAEVLLYEKNLTPSINANTYRANIKDADFVIMILDENYGTKTETGLSGTEEEFAIAIENRIKTHVYIKQTNLEDSNQKEFVNEIKEKGISYYFYKDEKDLLKRVQSSIMTIARDIAVEKITLKDLPNKEKKVFDYDYEIATGYLAINDAMVKYHKDDEIDYINTNIFLLSLKMHLNLFVEMSSGSATRNFMVFFARHFHEAMSISECIVLSLPAKGCNIL